ncbi:MAG: hydroxysqualene dehydroxylase, partial [Candidatus Dormibacteria bacterium]
MDAVVVGGGLAGISAALELADLGHQVTLVERSRTLGGLCRSVPDPVAGRVDTGQHVFLGCCTALEELLRRLQAPPAVRQERLELVVVTRSGRWRRLRSAPLPGALHLLPVLLGWPGLPSRSLPAAARASGALRAMSDSAGLLDSVPARSWLESLGQDPALIEGLWEPFLVSACNVSLEHCSAELAAFVIRQGLLAGPGAAALRIPATDLTAWLDPPARRELERSAVRLELDWRATELAPDARGRHRLREASGREITADWVVLASAAGAARRLLGDRADPGLRAAAELPASPIVNIHLFTDRPFLP